MRSSVVLRREKEESMRKRSNEEPKKNRVNLSQSDYCRSLEDSDPWFKF